MSQRHATDVVSLVFGMIFAGVFAVWVLTGAHLIDFAQVWLAGPVILIAAGVVGLGAALRSDARSGGDLR
jgi:hypothetical protein